MKEPTKEQWGKFNRHHITEELVPENKWGVGKFIYKNLPQPKWLGNMTKEEIRNGYEEVQRELKECEDENIK